MAVKIIEGGVNAAAGYKTCGLRAGIKPGKTNKDMAMILSDVPAVAAGTFTRNLVKAAPVKWDSMIIEKKNSVRAVVVNTGFANASTGNEGYENSKKTAEKTAEAFGLKTEEVLVASTGVIGVQLPMDVIFEGVDKLKTALSYEKNAGDDAAEAIMTTDTHSKQAAVSFNADGKECIMGGMCKGSGMIHPNMGTMLCFITTDCNVDRDYMQEVLRSVVNDTFNMVSVDGDTSTNDTVILLSNGVAGNKLISAESSDEEKAEFEEALRTVCGTFAKEIAKDGEGATRLFTAMVKGAADEETARILAKSIITSNLTKAAIFGKDANWGRIMCAMGYSGASFDPDKTDIFLSSVNGEIKLVENGVTTGFSEEKALDILSADEITAICDVKEGNASAVAWGCDLTYEYVKINGDYRS